MATQSVSPVPQLGELLRYWRHERGKSQLDLSLDTGISQRHLSFVESGRSTSGGNFLSLSVKGTFCCSRRDSLLSSASNTSMLSRWPP